MGILVTLSTVLFLLLSILLIILILLQSDKSAGMGILGGSSQSAFGSSTADVITKITGVMVAIFMLGSLGLAVLKSYQTNHIEKEFMSSDIKPAAETASPETETQGTGGQEKQENPVPANTGSK